MSLTTGDLQAIRGVVKEVVGDAIEESKQHTAAGFAEVHTKIDGLDGRLSNVEKGLIVVENRLSHVEDRLTNVEDRLSGVENRTTSLESKLNDVADTVGRIELQQRGMVEQLDDHAMQLRHVNVKLQMA